MGKCSLVSLHNVIQRNLVSLWFYFLLIVVIPTISLGFYIPATIQTRTILAPSSSHQPPTTIKTTTRCQMTTLISGIESTPNPSSFLIRISTPADKGLQDMAGSLRGKTFTSNSFIAYNTDDHEFTEIASILKVDGVTSIFAMATALTINKKPSAKWEVVLPLVVKALGSEKNDDEDSNDDDQNNQNMLLQSLLTLTSSSSSTSGTSNGASSSSATAGQVRMRVQFSNKIPIQLEGTGYLGTVQRRKLPSKFQEYMGLLTEGSNVSKFDFFGGRQWVDRGIRYYLPNSSHNNDNDNDNSISNSNSNSSGDDITITPKEQELLELDAVLQMETDEVDTAYSTRRLNGIVANIKNENSNNDDNRNQQKDQSNTENGKGLKMVSTSFPSSSSSSQILDLEAVDRFCDLAEQDNNSDAKNNALKVLATFVSGRLGSLPARRNALAYLGGTGGIISTSTNTDADTKEVENTTDLVFDAVVSALQHEKSPIMRRTAGDALSDLGDPRAISSAITALEEDRSKLVQWRAARILGDLGDTVETVSVLKQASFSSSNKYAFEVAFEIKDALRKVQSRVRLAIQQTNDSNNNTNDTTTTTPAAPRKGPVWKQIQEGMVSKSSE